MKAVPADEWNLKAMADTSRKCRLLASTTPNELLRRVGIDARAAVSGSDFSICSKESNEQEGYWRTESTVRLKTDTFDQLFNGRMGYRALYYKSLDCGKRFNRLLVNRIVSTIEHALLERRLNIPIQWEKMKNSLLGPHSKIWVVDDWAAFYHEPHVLRPSRWVDYWKHCYDFPLGLCAPLPDEPKLDLKGSFIHESTGDLWLPESKKYRHEKIHKSGWT